MVRASLTFLVALGVTCSAAGQPPAVKGRTARIAAAVAYQDLMLVIATKDGAAAVVFGDREDDGNEVEYQYRYESADGKQQLAGKGRLFEHRSEKGGFKPQGLYIKAGPISIEWSKGNKARGWIYYVPEDVTVHLAHADNFKHRVREFGLHTIEDQELDLRRFMKK